MLRIHSISRTGLMNITFNQNLHKPFQIENNTEALGLINV